MNELRCFSGCHQVCSGPYPSCDTTVDFVQTGVCINSTVCVVHLQAGEFTQSSTACVDDVSNTCLVGIIKKGNLIDDIRDLFWVRISKKEKFLTYVFFYVLFFTCYFFYMFFLSIMFFFFQIFF